MKRLVFSIFSNLLKVTLQGPGERFMAKETLPE